MNSSVQLSICGDVERPVRLTLAELRSVMDAEVVADFHCREGWSRLGERWRGVRLRTLLALAGAADAAGYVTVGCGDYTAVLTRGQAEDERVLLALEHEGAASPREAGFPRLVGPSDWDCFLGVKSVDRIEVTRQPQQATAATIALARLERLGVCHPSLNGGMPGSRCVLTAVTHTSIRLVALEGSPCRHRPERRFLNAQLAVVRAQHT